jgi:hypothetical protein
MIVMSRTVATIALALLSMFFIAVEPTPVPETVVEETEVSPASVEEADETQYHFHLASASFVENDLRTSAKETREAADSLRKKLSDLQQDLRPALQESVAEMEGMAEEIEKGRLGSVKRLHAAFARAEIVLAKNHVKRAQQAWEDKAPSEAGQELALSTKNLESAMIRTAYKDDGTAEAVVKRGRTTSTKILDGAITNPAEVVKTFTELDKAIFIVDTFTKSVLK